MDVGNINGWKLDEVVPSAELLGRINAEMPVEPVDKNYRGEVADRYRYVDGTGEIGFISSVTEAFCSDCTRARLSTDGKLFTCLFAGEGRDLRGPMRDGASDTELEALITDVWAQRTDRYSEIRTVATEHTQRKVEMYQIGG
jgi:cyclic pyranopterin phosphate synthase